MRTNIEKLLSKEMLNALNTAKKSFKNEAREIVEKIDCLIESLENDAVKMATMQGNNKDIINVKNEYIVTADLLQILSNYLLPEYDEETYEADEEMEAALNKDNNEKTTINYDDEIYKTDENIPHTLYENFTHTRPAYAILDNERIEGKQWKELFLNVCASLVKRDSDIFYDFLNDDLMKGKSCSYFSQDKSQFRDPKLIKNTDIYVESNFSSQTIRNIFIKMLERYKIPKYKFKIYLRKDYTPLHKTSDEPANNNILSVITDSQNSEIKIGKLAKEFFSKYFNYPISKAQLQNFMNKDWCTLHLGIRYPLLKLINTNEPISKQRGYNNQYGRYYATPFNINGAEYLLCSQWYEEFRPKLSKWITENDISLVKDEENTVATNEFKGEVQFGDVYAGLHIKPETLSHILCKMKQFHSKNGDIAMGDFTKKISKSIEKNISYQKVEYPIQKIREYLLKNDIIKLKEGNSKNRYIIYDSIKLQELIDNPYIADVRYAKHINLPKEKHFFLINKSQRKRCPICGTLLQPVKLNYNVYSNSVNGIASEPRSTYGKHCQVCHKRFITIGTYATIIKPNKNIFDMSNVSIDKTYYKE